MVIKGKTALITGAAGDLGSALLQSLLEAGAAHIIALDINADKLAAFTQPNITAITCDVSNFAAVQAALEQAFKQHPAIDILINGAGILHSAPLVNMLDKTDDSMKKAAADWQRCLDINLSSVFYVTQIVAQRMCRARTKGVIVNISSVSAGGNAGQGAYSASKAGVNALTQVWAKELGAMGIRAVAVAPGYIDTPSTRSAVSESQLADITSRIPLKKMGEPRAIAQAVRFAIENDYVNGTVLEIDGGLVI